VADAKPIDTVLRYHALSTHQPSRFAPGPGRLDWASQPDPFRTYEGAPVLELPLAGDDLEATWEDLHRPSAVPPRALDRGSLGAFLELALGLTAWKEYGSARWSLRANPSSGNLHPTEGYVLVPGAPGLEGGLYHYVSRDHVIERRWTPEAEDRLWLEGAVPHNAFLVGLASIHWREAWKYGERAFRYCQHDAGHALASVRYAAAVLGWSARLLEAPGDDDVARLLGLEREDAAALPAPDREHPDALVLVAPPDWIADGVARLEASIGDLVSRAARGRWTGLPNALSSAHVEWPEIDGVAAACRKPRRDPSGEGSGSSPAPLKTQGGGGATRAADLIRQRRSAVDMDGRTSLPAAGLCRVLGRLLPREGVPPWDLLPWSPRIHPVLFVHRVDGLPPGVYLLERDESVHHELARALRDGFEWIRPEGVTSSLPLFLLEDGDARSFARFASCHQGIASESAFSLGMLSVFEESLGAGAWWYRRLFWEAGVLGQVLYLEAEAAGLRGTGIGCYFDDVVHEVLGLEDAAFRDLYHFTVGGPVDDLRLATGPAYGDDVHRRE
jgi:SagB-type dehydrogenase family enzyme